MTESEAETGASNLTRKRFSSRSPRQTPEHKMSPKSSPKMSPKLSPKKCSKKMDGYEADTDDTLQRRIKRKSVKELAGMFQRAENACPSPLPFRPKQCPDSDYDSDSRTTDSIIFNQSRAYIPPKWAPLDMIDKGSASFQTIENNQSSTQSQNSENTKILRLNQCEMMSSDLVCSTSQKFESSTSQKFESSTTTSFSKNFNVVSEFGSAETKPVGLPSVIFTPKKFVPVEPKTSDDQTNFFSVVGSESASDGSRYYKDSFHKYTSKVTTITLTV